MSFPVTIKAFNLGDIFSFFFDGIGVSTHCEGVVVTPFLASLAPRTSLLMVLVLFANLVLVGRRLLVLATRRVRGRSVSELSPSRVFVYLFRGFISSRIPRIHLLDT